MIVTARHTQTLEVTDVHPFWVVTDDPDLERAARAVVDENGVTLYHHNIDPTENGFWVEAKDLRVGDVFLGANGELTTVVAIERVDYPDGVMVYNFSVDGNHNYFVIAACDEFGQTSVLVHDASKGGKQNIRPSEIPANWSVERIRTYLAQHGKNMTTAQKRAIEGYLKTKSRLETIKNINVRSLLPFTPAGIISDIINRIFREPDIHDGKYIMPGIPNPHWSPLLPGSDVPGRAGRFCPGA